MRLHELKNVPGAVHRRKRVGCGEGSGHGKTSTKGGKGQTARSGGSIRPGFEGGQMPLYRKLPHRGFNNYEFRTEYAVVNLDQLNARFEAGAVVTVQALRERGLVAAAMPVKVLGRGELDKALTVQVHKVSASAAEKIARAGGTTENLTATPAGA